MRVMRRTLALGTIALLAYRYFKGNGSETSATSAKKAPARSGTKRSRSRRTTKSPRSRAKSKTS